MQCPDPASKSLFEEMRRCCSTQHGSLTLDCRLIHTGASGWWRCCTSEGRSLCVFVGIVNSEHCSPPNQDPIQPPPVIFNVLVFHNLLLALPLLKFHCTSCDHVTNKDLQTLILTDFAFTGLPLCKQWWTLMRSKHRWARASCRCAKSPGKGAAEKPR